MRQSELIVSIVETQEDIRMIRQLLRYHKGRMSQNWTTEMTQLETALSYQVKTWKQKLSQIKKAS